MLSIAAASEPISIVAGSCSANIVDSVINVPITITCGTQGQDKTLQDLVKPPMTTECAFKYPSAWSIINDPMNQVASIIVPPGNELSGYEFVFSLSLLEATAWQKFYLSADLIELTEDQKKTLGGVTDQELTRIQNFRASRPGPIVQETDYNKAVDQKEKFPDAILTVSPLRSLYSLEDGKDYASSVLDVYLLDKKLVAEVWVSTYVDAYPDLDDKVPLYNFRCEANASMPTDIFAKLCVNLIEDTTLDAQFGSKKCYMSDEGGFKAVQEEEDNG